MEAIIEKILSSKKPFEEQKSYLTFVISKAISESDKIKYLMIIIEKTLYIMNNNDQVFMFF